MILKENQASTNAICTIIAKNYVAAARVLADSFSRYNPGIGIYALVIDETEDYINPSEEKFITITVNDLANNKIPEILFKYDVLEASTAIKPFFLDYLFEKYSLSKLIYLDPDILFTYSIDDIWNILDNSSIILTPHLLSPTNSSNKHIRAELDILRCGTYNLGFIALARSNAVSEFLPWWKSRVEKYCSKDITPLFTDQKWINLVPSYFDNVCILRNPGYNVAYWNLSNREITDNNGNIIVNGWPLRFFHFSGLDISDLNGISKYQDRYTLDDFPMLRPLFNHYKNLLLENDYDNSSRWPYSHSYFDNGIIIPEIVRKIYQDMSINDNVGIFGNPFKTGPGSFYEWLGQPVNNADKLCNLWYRIYLSRSDLKLTFPDLSGKNTDLFTIWIKSTGISEYQLQYFCNQLGPISNIEKSKRLNMIAIIWLNINKFVSKLLGKYIKDPYIKQGLSDIRKGIDRIILRN